MSENHPFHDALAPLAARLPRVVREQEILRIGATIFGKPSLQISDVARKEVLAWAQRRAGGRLPSEAWDGRSFEYFSGGRNSIGVSLRTDDSDIWAIRIDDPDKMVPGRTWTTEAVIGSQLNEAPRFSVRLLLNTPEDQPAIEPHAPGFVQQIAERCGLAVGPVACEAEPWIVEDDDTADDLIALLVNPARHVPVFVLSMPDHEAAPLLDSRALARAVLGFGIVAVLAAPLTWKLTHRFERVRSVFGGAARAHMPGFSADADPYSHRLELADALAAPDGAARCQRWMRLLAASNSVRRLDLNRHVLSFAAIRSAELALRQDHLKRIGASVAEQLDAATLQITALQHANIKKDEYLDYFDQETKRAEERAEAAEEQLRAARFRIQQLEEMVRSEGTTKEDQPSLPATWAKLSDWCDNNLAGRLVLTPLARRQIRGSPAFRAAAELAESAGYPNRL